MIDSQVVRFSGAETFVGELSPRGEAYASWMQWEADKREALAVLRILNDGAQCENTKQRNERFEKRGMLRAAGAIGVRLLGKLGIF